ncbi:aminoimidazole riboside kinase [Serratia sp. 1D1416]|uniref:aminoimidazole riboside kinase n=1 Tax=Serratia sp. 1D1416 TaxID=2447890 RepID=UPI001013CF8B|nr:aminoimidazole riboside kinase [Serratia sp. 1D1416]
MLAKVWVLGDAVVDLISDEPGKLRQCPGGAPANVAVGIARLGGNSAFIGRVGDDPFGQLMRVTLQQEKVDTEFMVLDPTQRTSTVIVALDSQGERNFTFMVRPSADLFLEPSDLPTFQPGDWLHVCSIALSAEPCRSAAYSAMTEVKQVGGWVSFDPNIRMDFWPDPAELHCCVERALQFADVVKFSEEEMLFFSGESGLTQQNLQRLSRDYQLKLLIVTLGKAGVLVCYQGQVQHYPSQIMKSVDTTGAGDAFVAGLLWGMAERGLPLNEPQLAQCLAEAQICGALATTALGAMTALPDFIALQRHRVTG